MKLVMLLSALAFAAVVSAQGAPVSNATPPAAQSSTSAGKKDAGKSKHEKKSRAAKKDKKDQSK